MSKEKEKNRTGTFFTIKREKIEPVQNCLKGEMKMIEFRNVSKKYGTGTEAVKNANFKIDKGEFAFLVGSSGSGKSTLIKLILKEEEPTQWKYYNKWKRHNIFKTK